MEARKERAIKGQVHCGKLVWIKRGAGSCGDEIGARNASWYQDCHKWLLGSEKVTAKFSVPLTTTQKIECEEAGGREGVGPAMSMHPTAPRMPRNAGHIWGTCEGKSGLVAVVLPSHVACSLKSECSCISSGEDYSLVYIGPVCPRHRF